MKLHRTLVAVALLMLMQASGWASVIYTFIGTTSNGGPFPVSSEEFTLTVPTFINAPQVPDPGLILGCDQLDSSLNCGLGIILFIDTGGDFPDTLEFLDKNGAGFVYRFPAGSFTTEGLHLSEDFGDPTSNSGSLRVMVATEQPVPEPSSRFLMFSAVVSGCFLLRKSCGYR